MFTQWWTHKQVPIGSSDRPPSCKHRPSKAPAPQYTTSEATHGCCVCAIRFHGLNIAQNFVQLTLLASVGLSQRRVDATSSKPPRNAPTTWLVACTPAQWRETQSLQRPALRTRTSAPWQRQQLRSPIHGCLQPTVQTTRPQRGQASRPGPSPGRGPPSRVHRARTLAAVRQGPVPQPARRTVAPAPTGAMRGAIPGRR